MGKTGNRIQELEKRIWELEEKLGNLVRVKEHITSILSGVQLRLTALEQTKDEQKD